MAVQEHETKTACTHAIDLFAFNSLAFMGAQTDTLQWGQISSSLLYLLRGIGSLEQFGTRSRSSSERAYWIGDVRSVFVFCFCFPMFVYQVKTVPHIPLYMTSTYNSKTAVQYRMTPIYNSTLTTAQYRTFTIRSYKPYLLDYLAKHLCCARSVLHTRYLHKLPGYIDTIPTIYIFMRHLQHQDIEGHLLRLYIYFMRGYLHHERHGTAIVLAKPEHRKDKDYPLSVFVFVFCVFFSFHGRL